MRDCLDPAGMIDAYAAHASALEDWHAAGRQGPRPPGRLRRLPIPQLTALQRKWAAPLLETVHDPDGRPRALRKADRY